MRTTHSQPIAETCSVEIDATEHRALFVREPIYQGGVAVSDRWLLAPEVTTWLSDRAPGIESRWDYGEMDGADPVVWLRFTDEDLASEFVSRFAGKSDPGHPIHAP